MCLVLVKVESVIPDKPVWKVWADLGQHFTHMHKAQTSQNGAHVILAANYFPLQEVDGI